jgi:hypothetical protein
MMPACLRGRLREQNNCGEERKHSNEFLLHHHSTGYKVALPIACTRRIAMNGGRIQGGAMGRQNDFRCVQERNFCDPSVMMTRYERADHVVRLVDTYANSGGAFAPPRVCHM